MENLNLILCVILFIIKSSVAEHDLFTSALIPDHINEDIQSTDFKISDAKPSKPNVKILNLIVDTDIKYRYAVTKVTSKVANHENTSQEIMFSLVVPETAFVSKFYMEIQNKTYDAYVKEKEAAKKEYTEAVASGQAAAHVELAARDSNTFRVSVNVEPQTKVKFSMTYEQLLARTLGRYEHIVNINPGQLVKNMSVTVNILEANNITELEVPELKTSNEITDMKEEPNSLAAIERPNGNSAIIKWTPTLEEQEKMNKLFGAKGQIVVRYDVDRASNPDQILLDEGYFVHFYAPPNLPTLNKHVIFVLDLSGSMYGIKLSQLKDAMTEILGDLRTNDYFTIVLFSNRAHVWSFKSPNETAQMLNDDGKEQSLSFKEHVIKVNTDNILKAIKSIKSMEDFGGTNIIDGLRKGIQMADLAREEFANKVEIPEPIILFLTDGEPNIEMTEADQIIKEVNKLNPNHYQLFSLAFGMGADFDLLRRLSLSNSGFARNIYEASDAALQLRNFYKQVASPLLSNVTFNYIPGQVDFNSTTNTEFPTLFSGSELVVAGKLNPGIPKNEELKKLIGNIQGRSVNGSQHFEFPEISNINDTHLVDFVDTLHVEKYSIENRTHGHLERAWAYLTVQQLLNENSLNQTKLNASRTKALELSLEYSFVTPLTSLVVVKPNDTASNALETKESNALPSPGGMYKVGMAHYSAVMPAALSASSFGSPAFDSASFSSMKYSMHAAQGLPGPPSIAYDVANEMYTDSLPQEALGTKIMTPDMEAALENYAKLYNFTLGKSTEVPNITYQECNNSYTIGSTPSVLHHCKHVTYCLLAEMTLDTASYEPHQCIIDNKYLGICCPDDIQPKNSSGIDPFVDEEIIQPVTPDLVTKLLDSTTSISTQQVNISTESTLTSEPKENVSEINSTSVPISTST